MNNIMLVLAGDIAGVDLQTELEINNINTIICADGGYNHLRNCKIKPNLIIGDMDSMISPSDDIKLIKFPKDKDYSDFKLALMYIEKNFIDFNIYVYGFASVNRIDHVYANLNEINNNITFISSNQRIILIDKYYEINSDNYQYYSFFALKKTLNLTINGFKYPLENYELNTNDSLCLSNEKIKKQKATIEFTEGKLLMICSHNN